MTRQPPPAHAEDVAIARKILLDNAGVIGLYPAPPLAGRLWPIQVRLGRALRMLVAKPIGLIRGPHGGPPGDPASPAPAPDATVPYRLKEIDGFHLVELVLPAALGLGEAAAHLDRATRAAAGNFGHVLLDLDGYLPDVPETREIPDAFISVALAGATRERDLLATVELLPTARHLGTLLVDPQSQTD